MRPIILALAAFLCVGAYADRLIDIPTGRKIPMGVFRLESRFDQANFGSNTSLLDFGIDTSFEGSIRYTNELGNRRILSGDLSYNFIAPFPDVSPGLSFGVQDLANKTEDGRKFFAVATYKVGGADLWTPVEFTVGAQYERRVSMFVGLFYPLTPRLRLLAEHDGMRISAGGEWKQSDSLFIRYVFRDSVPVLSFRFQTKL